MIWQLEYKEQTMKKKFAWLPKRIGDYRIWLQKYYLTYDYISDAQGGAFVPVYFIHAEQCKQYIASKEESFYEDWFDDFE